MLQIYLRSPCMIRFYFLQNATEAINSCGDTSRQCANRFRNITPPWYGYLLNIPSTLPSMNDLFRISLLGNVVKRAESMRVGGSPSAPGFAEGSSRLKRTPSFTTRKRTTSMQKIKQMDNMDEVEMFGFLERKHEQQSGGKRAAIRSWKTYYTGVFGSLFAYCDSLEIGFDLLNLLDLSSVRSTAVLLQGAGRFHRK